ncbi:hypothetical protein [Rhodospirillaceae bacterium SYSU D60014]|uniref:hypothetical protein n=1 Tax=Virgifigura deserti TaxID=2268457 RepID=UPI000E663255
MALRIETFSNVTGGNSFFKAVTHPLAARSADMLLQRLAAAGRVAVYDPLGLLEGLAEFYDLSSIDVAGVFVQNVEGLGRSILGRPTQPVTDLPALKGLDSLLVVAFDAQRPIDQIRHLIPAGTDLISLDEMRLPDALLTNRRRYLDPLNFATNIAFFRDGNGHHTRLTTANYWVGYGADAVSLWACLLDEGGRVLAEWQDPLPTGVGSVTIDSQEVRRRFGLPDFTGQLFLHVVGAAGHDVVKYALDTYGDAETVLSCTHDANAWPAALYAGLPAPAPGERVLFWLQNSHPCPIPAGAVGFNLMGDSDIRPLGREIAPFATAAVDVAELLPDARWPQQIEIQAGKHFVRPRYEVVAAGERRRIAHVNVERTDLAPDPQLPELANLLGKGFILPAPLLPVERWRSLALPTPMTTAQEELPLAAIVYAADGRELARRRLGRLQRRDSVALDISALLEAAGADLDGGFGHVELVYDFAEGGAGDGWLHALFRYEDRRSGHAAETSFGAHIFNTVLTYGGEPQSYHGRPPGLSTRLFLRLGPPPFETFCHLIYPASTPWHPLSRTAIALFDSAGRQVAERQVAIPCSGSLLWRYDEMFATAERDQAGDGAYAVVRDTTCRLFGYHGLMRGDDSFSLDHMFGF